MPIRHCTKRFVCGKTSLFNQRRHGYIVLVPEIGEDLPEHNPLLRDDGQPEFNSITVEKCVATIGKQAIDVEKNVQTIEEFLSTADSEVNVFKDVLTPIEHISTQMETTWGLAKTLYLGNSSMMPTKSYLVINERARRARHSIFTSLPILKAVGKELQDNKNLSESEKRLLEKFALEGKLNGVLLDEKNKAILNDTLEKLRQERATYKAKLDVAIQRFNHTINDYNFVREFPTDLLQSMAADPINPSKGPWKVSLQPTMYHKFLENCHDRTVRWNVWQANIRKCSGYGEKLISNSVHVEEIRNLRKMQAKFLGYKNFVDMSMETKMAGSVENVNAMMDNLLAFARPAQETEVNTLAEYSAKNGFQHKLEVYDIPYWKRKHFKSIHNYDEDIVREYFPVPKVLSGLFRLCESLLHIKIVERDSLAETWHEDVKQYDIFDASDLKSPIASFYLDLYSREDHKLRFHGNSGYTVGIRNRSVSNTLPYAALIFNFQMPLYGKPSLLSFTEVQTLFSKFGQSMQHLLTQVNTSELAGLSNVEWDVVDVCGHVISNFLYNGGTLKQISSHYTSEEIIPDNLILAIQDHRKHMSGYLLCNELYLASLDLALHSKTDFWLDIIKNLWPQFSVLPLDKTDSHPCSFSEIFSGDWAAAYFSNFWSRVIAADVYGAFHEVENSSQDVEVVGKRFRETFLALGGSCHPSEVFRRFRGRDPSEKALLKTLGLNKKINEDTK